MTLFKTWVHPFAEKCILFFLLIPNLILFFLPVANEEMAASFYGIEVNDLQYMISLYYVGFASFYILERRFYAYLTSKQYFIYFQVLQLICCCILLSTNNLYLLFAVRFFQGMLFASSVNLYMSLVMTTMKSFWAKEITYSLFFGMLLCTGSLNNLITADILDQFSFGVVYQCAIIIYTTTIMLVLITMSANTQVKKIPLVQLDTSSFILLATILSIAGYLSIYGQQYYWFQNIKNVLLTVLLVLCLFLFIKRQLHLKRPYINLSIFKTKQFWWGFGLLYIMYVERFSFSYSGSFFKQILKLDPKHISFMYTFNLSGIVLGIVLSACWLIYKKQAILLWFLGFICLFSYHFIMRFLMYSSGNDYYYFFPMFLHGLGIGVIIVPTILHCLSVVNYHLTSSAAAFCLIIRFAGYTTSSVLIKYFTLYYYNNHFNRFLENITANNSFYKAKLTEITNYVAQHGLEKNLQESISEKLIKKMIDNQILMRSIMDYYTLMMYLSLFVIFLLTIYALRNKNYKIIFKPFSPI